MPHHLKGLDLKLLRYVPISQEFRAQEEALRQHRANALRRKELAVASMAKMRQLQRIRVAAAEALHLLAGDAMHGSPSSHREIEWQEAEKLSDLTPDPRPEEEREDDKEEYDEEASLGGKDHNHRWKAAARRPEKKADVWHRARGHATAQRSLAEETYDEYVENEYAEEEEALLEEYLEEEEVSRPAGTRDLLESLMPRDTPHGPGTRDLLWHKGAKHRMMQRKSQDADEQHEQDPLKEEAEAMVGGVSSGRLTRETFARGHAAFGRPGAVAVVAAFACVRSWSHLLSFTLCRWHG